MHLCVRSKIAIGTVSLALKSVTDAMPVNNAQPVTTLHDCILYLMQYLYTKLCKLVYILGVYP